MKKCIGMVTVFMLMINGYTQEMPSAEVIQRAMAFHDPTLRWYESDITLIVETKIAPDSERTSWIELQHRTGNFQLKMLKDSELLEWYLPSTGPVEVKRNFLTVRDSTQLAQNQLTPERANWWRDYYSFLYGLPMNLKDEGTIWSEMAQLSQFLGREVWAVRVTYSPEVGDDTWYFYFDTNTFALRGYRFYHDEEANDGEYILLEDMEIKGNLRIPKKRTWYTNQGDKLLGIDLLVGLKIEEW